MTKQSENKKQQIFSILGNRVKDILQREAFDFDKLQEIRLRIGQPLMVAYDNEEQILPNGIEEKYLVTKADAREVLERSSHYSLYAYEQEMRQGFLTIEGGHRVGITGKTMIEEEHVKNIQYISSINIRVSHEVIGCANQILPYITANKMVCQTLIVSPPRCGKTTLIRDLVRQISNGNEWVKGCSVGVVDERSELGGCYMGIAQNQLGIRTDILDCCPKAEGMIMLIRSMAPRVIAVDEIGTAQEVRAIEYAMHCGCKLIASIHGASIDEIRKRPIVESLIQNRRFERFVVLDHANRIGHVKGIYDERGSILYAD